ncbi:hypothetical protein GW17_00021755 [Ensete ventricosum]|nr:hypothetical protein GW17_00021755 [Ensete ventricosum]
MRLCTPGLARVGNVYFKIHLESTEDPCIKTTSIPSARSAGKSPENPKASSSGTSSGAPSSMDMKALRDLEVMKACHDFDSIMAEGSLAAIWERYNISNEYALHAPFPKQHLIARVPRGYVSLSMLWK